MAHTWRGWVFDAPEALGDDIVMVLAGGPLSVTFSRDATDGRALEAYVDEAVREIAVRSSGFRLVKRESSRVAGKSAVLVDQRARGDAGEKLSQAQAFIHDDDGFTVVTVTAVEGDADARAALTSVLASMRAAP